MSRPSDGESPDGTPHAVRIINMMSACGPHPYQIEYWGADACFRQIGKTWFRRVGLGNWARVSEPVKGERVGSVLDGRRKTVYYGDPTLYMLRWTEYEDVGALDQTFFAVFGGDKETEVCEWFTGLRWAFEQATDKRAFIKANSPRSHAWLGGRGRDRSRDNPLCVVYIDSP